jgi:hypothetical protein
MFVAAARDCPEMFDWSRNQIKNFIAQRHIADPVETLAHRIKKSNEFARRGQVQADLSPGTNLKVRHPWSSLRRGARHVFRKCSAEAGYGIQLEYDIDCAWFCCSGIDRRFGGRRQNGREIVFLPHVHDLPVELGVLQGLA